MDKKDILEKAIEITGGDRQLNYGRPEDNFQRIANFWNTYLEDRLGYERAVGISTNDVAVMMILMKVARLQNQPLHMDSAIDIAGYAGCLGEIIDGRYSGLEEIR